jgi:hypothetical protein
VVTQLGYQGGAWISVNEVEVDVTGGVERIEVVLAEAADGFDGEVLGPEVTQFVQFCELSLILDDVRPRLNISPMHCPGPNAPVVVHRNRNRDAINCAMFEEYCATYAQTDSDVLFEGAVLIFMDDLSMRDERRRMYQL